MSTAPARILVVDDDEGHLAIVGKVLQREGYEVVAAANGEAALERLRERQVDLIVTDLMMPGINGIDLLKAARAILPSVEVIVMTAFASVERAVEAMREGAYDFIEKPIKRALLLKSTRQALERKALVAENASLREALDQVRAEREIVGRSEPIRHVMEMVRQVAPTGATVLVQGASGTGKELVARAIHQFSTRRERPFIAVNCAALPAAILESELFGHEKGAFTGAHQRKPGRFELADGGTLFLDEIGELHHDMQAKLLRVLQEGEFERVGGSQTQRVDARIVAATNRDLDAEVKAGRFREDLFYRLNVIQMTLPPLRDRQGDIPLLVQHFIERFAARNGKPVRGLSGEALQALQAWSWPGNVRELENLIERAVVLCRGESIGVDELPDAMRDGEPERRSVTIALGTPLEDVERLLIRETLALTRGDKRLAAQLLGIATRTIYRKLDSV